jgi:RND family efflux transporter MFP subunit
MAGFKLLAPSLLGILLISGCNAAPGSTSSASSNGRGGRGGEDVVRKVTTVLATEKPIEQLVVVTGTLAAEQEIVLGMKVNGRISELPVDLGSAVRKGDVIAKLDTTDFQLRMRQSEAALQQARVRLGLSPSGTDEDVNLEQLAPVRQARAQMDGAKARLDRAQQLSQGGLLAKADLDATSSAYKVTEAQYADSLDEARNRQGVLAQRKSELEIARQQLADTILTSPIDGVVRVRSANVGQYVAAGGTIATIVQMSPLRLRTEVPERESRNIHVSMPVRLTVEGSSGTHQGKVARLSPSFDEVNRTLLVETEVANPGGLVRPGAFARAEIVTSSNQQALMVPSASVVTFAGIDRVFTVTNDAAAEKRVKIGRRTEAGVEILEGIKAGDNVVLNPGNMTDGEKVLVNATPR